MRYVKILRGVGELLHISIVHMLMWADLPTGC
jgi:hypothetical protein